VAEVAKPILNGNPGVEPGYSGDAVSLASALALPLEDSGRVAGVLALYRAAKDAFTAEELLELSPLAPAIAAVLAEREIDVSETHRLGEALAYEAESPSHPAATSTNVTALV
jgi:GAF domain-containing protein